MQKVFNVAVDIGRKLPAPAFDVNTNDLKSVKLLITITNGQTLLDLTDTTVRIAIRKPDNNIIFQDCTIKDAKTGQVEIVLENQAYIMAGTHTAEIMCYKGSDVVAVSGTFSYKSTKGIMNDEAVESKSEFTSISNMMKDVQDTIDDIRENGTGIDAKARSDIEDVTAALANTKRQVYDNMYKNLSVLNSYNSSINIIGDSISEGYNVDYANEYATLLSKKIFELDKTKDYEMVANFSALPPDITISGTRTYGTKGPVKKSLIMEVGDVITINRAIDYLEFFYYRSLNSGKLEVRANGTLYKTIDCSGSETFDASTWSSAISPIASGTKAIYTVTCIDSPVELTGIMSLNTSTSAIKFNRFALSSTTTNDYIDTPTLTAIKKIGSFNTSYAGLYIIALGTNDIYNATKSVASSVYKANLKTIATFLLNSGNKVILTVPPKANESIYPARVEPYLNYKKKVYELAEELSLPVIDYSTIDFKGEGLYSDGVHPNSDGHKKMFETISQVLANHTNLILQSTSLPQTTVIPSVRAYNNADISITSGVLTPVPLNSGRFDNDSIHDMSTNNSRLVCKTAGIYNIFGGLEYMANSTGNRGISIRLNGNTYLATHYAVPPTGLGCTLAISTCYSLNVGDYVELIAYQTSGAPLNLRYFASYSPEFGMIKIG